MEQSEDEFSDDAEEIVENSFDSDDEDVVLHPSIFEKVKICFEILFVASLYVIFSGVVYILNHASGVTEDMSKLIPCTPSKAVSDNEIEENTALAGEMNQSGDH